MNNRSSGGLERAILIVAIAVCPVYGADEQGLVGRWVSVETSKGGIGAMYEFRSNGTFQFSPGAIVEMPYRMEGDELILPSGTIGGPEQKFKLQWTGKTRFQMSANGEDGGTFERQGRQVDGGNPLAGEWLGSRQMGQQRVEARFIFDTSGSCRLLIKFSSQQGTWSANGGSLAARINGAQALEGKFEVSGPMLTIYRSGGRVTRLKRY